MSDNRTGSNASTTVSVLETYVKVKQDPTVDWNVAIVIDCASQINVFINTKFLSNIREGEVIDICGVSNNTTSTNKIGTHLYFGDCYISPHTPTNIVSMNLLTKLFIITYNSDVTNSFLCYNDSVSIEFAYHKSGFWIYKGATKRSKLTCVSVIAAPVMIGKSGHMYSAVEVNRAKAFSKFHLCIGHPSDDVAKAILNYNVYPDCPLVARDVDVCRDIFGPCPYCAIGKTTTPSASDSTNLPTAELGTLLHVDLVTFFGFGPFLLASEDRVNYLMVTLLKDKSAPSVLSGLERFITHMKVPYLHIVSHISSDHEVTFTACIEPLKNRTPPVLLTQVPAGQHEKKLERQVATIKSHMRATCAVLPYTLPPQCLSDLLYLIIQSLNNSTNSISGHLTPRNVIEKSKPSYKLACKTHFGSIISVPCAHTIDTHARALECIYLRTLNNGGIRALNINSGKVISYGPQFTILQPSPLTITAIQF